MKIKYLGTAAYEGVPSLFCNCRVCKASRALGGRNLRSRSQALINDDLLIDFNADTVWHYQRYNFDWEKIKGIIITHSHCDHLYPDDLDMARRGYTHEHRTVNIYATKSGYKAVKPFAKQMKDGELKLNPVKPFVPFNVGGYTVTPLRASHSPATSPVIYVIERGGKKLLYAHDTGVFCDETWANLMKQGHFDLISFDCTGCLGADSASHYRDRHMCLAVVKELVARFRNEKLIDDDTKLVLNHFSHNGGQTYDEMVRGCEKESDKYIVSYDGLEIEF